MRSLHGTCAWGVFWVGKTPKSTEILRPVAHFATSLYPLSDIHFYCKLYSSTWILIAHPGLPIYFAIFLDFVVVCRTTTSANLVVRQTFGSLRTTIILTPDAILNYSAFSVRSLKNLRHNWIAHCYSAATVSGTLISQATICVHKRIILSMLLFHVFASYWNIYQFK